MEKSQIEYISVDDLVFDPENPRLPSTLRSKKGADDYEEEVINWMLQYENVTELMGSIGEKGFFAAEPILVVSKDDKFEVVEGNRRLTAVKLLNDPSIATKKKVTVAEMVSEAVAENIPKSIPSIKFNNRTDVLAYLGYKHITGVQPWDSLAKAKYLKQLLRTIPEESFRLQCKRLAKIIGSRADYVRLLLVGVDVYEKIEGANFFDIPSLSEESFGFGIFYTALNRENISKYVDVDLSSDNPTETVNLENLENITKWIFEKNSEGFTRLGESRNLAQLNKILDSSYPKALLAFKEGKTLYEAVRLTDHPLEVFQQSIDDSLTYLKTARDYLHEIEGPNKTTEDTLSEIFRLSKILRSAVQDMIDDSDETED